MTWYPCEIETDITLDDIDNEYLLDLIMTVSKGLEYIHFNVSKDCDEFTELEVGPFTIKGNYQPGDPGRTYGPMELCYPPEGPECEVISIECGGIRLPDKYFNDDFLKRVIGLLCERAESDAKEQYDDRYDK